MATPARARPADTLRIVELLLLWEGAVRNERLTKVLGIHFTTASRLLSEYQRMNSAAVSYDQAGKRYVAESGLRPMLSSGEVDEYLALLKRQGVPPLLAIERTHLPLGTVTSHVFALVQRAAADGSAVRARHRSMRHPEPAAKMFFPHALVEAGRRWHVRAYVPGAGAFRDLALTRLSNLELLREPRPPEASPSEDIPWQTRVKVRLVPHPDLTEAQQRLVRDEYFPGASARVLDLRAALLPYQLHELRAATDCARQTPPDYQLAVDRPDRLSAWLLPS
jgi:hypothetical protein